ncbi:MAG: hypothetical protein AABY84_03615, partial [Candidatus Firestonebacteria bacterium]
GWNPDGLRVELESPDKNGELWYSIPFGVIQHTNKDLSYVAMHRFAALQTNKGGMAFLPCSGVQGIRAIPSEGKLGLRLGASAEGELDAKPGRINKDGTLDTEYNRHSTGALFSGHYQHNFAIHLYEGDWRDANLSERGRQLQEPPIIKEVNLSIKNSNSRRAIDSLLKIEPRSVDIAGFRVLQGQREVVIYETHGQPANACLQLNGKQYKTKLQPWGISVLQIKE